MRVTKDPGGCLQACLHLVILDAFLCSCPAGVGSPSQPQMLPLFLQYLVVGNYLLAVLREAGAFVSFGTCRCI